MKKMGVWMLKFWGVRKILRGVNAWHLLGIGIMGACFQAPHCCTWTMTDGNALCSLISYVFQHIALTRSYKVTYQWFELVQCK